MAVAPMGRADHVAAFDGRDGAGGYRLFARVQVGCAFDDVLAQQVEDLLLEESDLIHGPEPVPGRFQCDEALADQVLYLGYGLFAPILDSVFHTTTPVLDCFAAVAPPQAAEASSWLRKRRII